jgi:hypothetical protein
MDAKPILNSPSAAMNVDCNAAMADRQHVLIAFNT